MTSFKRPSIHLGTSHESSEPASELNVGEVLKSSSNGSSSRLAQLVSESLLFQSWISCSFVFELQHGVCMKQRASFKTWMSRG